MTSEKRKQIDKAWQTLQAEAKEVAQQEPCLQQLLQERVLNRKDLVSSLSHVLSWQLNDANVDTGIMQDQFAQVLRAHPNILYFAVLDMEATLDRDPACVQLLEPLLFFKGFQAVQTYRIAHQLWLDGRIFLAKLLQSACSNCYQVDIHPAATIGHGLLLDHATNIVVGETAKIGNNVSILHGVTLGGTGKESGDRHPKVADGVMIGAHAQLLGNIKVGKGAKIGAGAVVLEHVPAHTTYAGVPAVLVGKPDSDMPSLSMNQDFIHDL
jgi:serine O-acetyltransferase